MWELWPASEGRPFSEANPCHNPSGPGGGQFCASTGMSAVDRARAARQQRGAAHQQRRAERMARQAARKQQNQQEIYADLKAQLAALQRHGIRALKGMSPEALDAMARGTPEKPMSKDLLDKYRQQARAEHRNRRWSGKTKASYRRGIHRSRLERDREEYELERAPWPSD